MIKTAKRLMSFMLVLVMCVTFCPIEPLRTVADDPTPVTYECQPQSKTYDSEMDNVTVTWSMNVQRHWRVTESVVYMVNGNHSSFVARLNNDWSTNKFSYEFSVVSPNNYKYFVRTYYCENVSSPSSIYSIDSEEFTISYADKRFLRQPESGPYNQSTGKLDVKWSTNFKPEKVEVWNYSTIIDTLSPIGANGSYSFDAAVSSKPGYYLRAYWDDEHYKESNTFGVTSKLEFTTQPEDVEYYMNSAEVEVTCDTNFNPYKVEVIRKTGDEKVVYSSLYSHMTSSIGCCFVPTVDTVYFVRAYINENAYVDSESFRAYYPAGFKFLKEPQDGQYRAATMDFEAYFQLSFTPAQIQLMYYDEDDEEFKNTNEYELLSYSGNNYTIVVPYDFINTPLKVIAEYYGIDSDGNAKVNSISSRVFIARDIAASFIEQPTGTYLQPLLYPGIDYKLSWKTDFKPVKVEITYNHRWEDNKYVWDTAETVTSDLSSDMTITGFTPEAGVKYKVYAYYTDDDYVSSDEFSDDMSDLRFELQPSASYTLPNDKDPYVCTYEWSTSFVPDKIVFAYDYVDRHNWKKAFSFTRNINLYNKINTSLDVIEAGRNYCLLAYYGEGEYDFVVSDYFSASDEKLKELYHPNIMSQPWDGENGYYRGVLIPYNPVRVEHYLRGSKLEKSDVHQYTGSDLETFQNAYGINMAYLAPLRIDKYGIHEVRVYYTDDFYVSEYFAIGEPLEYTKQPQGGYMDYSMYNSSIPAYHKKVSFEFDLDIGDQVELQKQNIHNYGKFETVSTWRISEKTSSYEDEIWEEGSYRFVVNKCFYQPSENVYVPYESDRFEVEKDKTFIKQPSNAISPLNCTTKIEWKAAFYPMKVVIQKLVDGEYQDLETYANGSAIYLTLDDSDIDFRTMSYDFGVGTYRLRLWYGKNDNEYIDSETFEVEKYKFELQPYFKYKRQNDNDKWAVKYQSSDNLVWRTNTYSAEKYVLFRRPAGSDDSVPWDQFDITQDCEKDVDTNTWKELNEDCYMLRNTGKWEDYDYFIRAWMTADPDSYTDSDIFTVHMKGPDCLKMLSDNTFYYSGNFTDPDEEIAVPYFIKTNPGYTGGDLYIEWENWLELTRIEYNDEVFHVDDPEPINGLSGVYSVKFGDLGDVVDNQEKGLAFTLYFRPSVYEEYYSYYHHDEYDDDEEELDPSTLYEELVDGYVRSKVNVWMNNVMNSKGEEVDAWGFESGVIFPDADSLNLTFDNVYKYVGDDELRISCVALKNPGFKTIELPIYIPCDDTLVFQGIEYNEDFAPANNPDPIVIPEDYNTITYTVKLGDENATENFTNTGVMFTLVYKLNGFDEEAGIEREYSFWPETYDASCVDVNDEPVDMAFALPGNALIINFGFTEQPSPVNDQGFIAPYNGKCGISWRLNNAAAKQVMYRRPAGSDKDTPWEKVEISGYYSDHGYYIFNMDSTNTWGKYECFIRAWDNVEKWANEDVGVHYVGEKDYVDSEIFIVEMRGSDDTPGIYCIDSFKADGTYPEQEGMIFAGWYEDPEHTKPYKGDTGYAFAKFIDKDCLSIKWQVPVDFADKDTTDIRLISSLDCGKYNSMHLVLKFAENGSEIIDGTITRLYDTLNGYVDQENVAYVPEDVFCEDSHYFAAFTVTGMPKALYTTDLVAYAYIITEDGTTVYGDELNFRVSDDVNYHE